MHTPWDGTRFRELIELALGESGLSQRELAVMAHVSHSQISRWKAGLHRPSYDNVTALAAALAQAAPELSDMSGPLLAAAGYAAPEFRPVPPELRRFIEQTLPGDTEAQRRVIGMLEGTITWPAEAEGHQSGPPADGIPQAQ